MENSGKNLSIKIMEALKPILPKGIGVVVVSGPVNEDAELDITSNIPDPVALQFLESAMTSILTEPAIYIDEDSPENSN